MITIISTKPYLIIVFKRASASALVARFSEKADAEPVATPMKKAFS